LDLAPLDVDWIAVRVMADHVHALFILGERLSLTQVIAKAKADVSRKLGAPGGSLWQENSFERRVRENESLESYGFYAFMNPYVAGELGAAQSWGGWGCTNPSHLLFLRGLGPDGAPPPEWIQRARELVIPGD
jgi:hypothetical protein